MKILRIIPYFYPSISYGGPVNGSFNSTQAQANLGHDIQVLTTDAGELGHRIPFRTAIWDKVHVFYFKNISNTLAKKYNIYLPIGFILKSRKYIHKCDVIHIHEYFTLLTVITIFWAKQYHKKVVLQSHGSVIVNQYRGKTTIKTIFNRLFERWILNNCHAFLVLDFEERYYLEAKQVPPDRIHLINNGVNLTAIDHTPIIPIISNIHPSDTIKLAFLGRIHPIKGLDLLIDAIYILNSRSLHTTLWIAGPDECEKCNLMTQIERLGIQKQVIFTGILDETQKISLLKECDIYIQPSRSEPYPIAVAEAISCYKPVIVSENVGISRLVKDQFGLVSSLDPHSIADMIERLATNFDLRNKYIQNAKAFSRHLFSWPVIAGELIEIYKR